MSRDDLEYLLDIVERCTALSNDLVDEEALEVLHRFSTAAKRLGAMTAAELADHRDLSRRVLEALSTRNNRFRQLRRTPSGSIWISIVAPPPSNGRLHQ